MSSWILEILFNIGKFLIDTEVGQIITQVAEGTIRILGDALHPVINKFLCPGHIILDPNDPLQGQFTGCFTFEVNGIECKVSQPRMFRLSLNSPWDLAESWKNFCLKKL